MTGTGWTGAETLWSRAWWCVLTLRSLSASELRAGCSMRSMMTLICVIVRLGGITVSLHWGGRFGVRESGEPIPAHLWVMVK